MIDVQGKLAQVMHEKDALLDNLRRLISGIRILEIPVVWMEQTPDKMGPTVPEIAELLKEETPVAKSSFGCCQEEKFMKRLKELGRTQVLIAGIETHVCVYQTAKVLAERGYEVEVVADCTSARTPSNKAIGLDRMKTAGAHITSVEMALFELLKTAEHPKFKDILKVVK